MFEKAEKYQKERDNIMADNEALHNQVEKIKSEYKKGRFDIVHSHMTLTNFYTLAIAKFFGTKITISHSHNSFIVKSKIKGLEK